MKLGRRQRLSGAGTEVDDCVCAMGEHESAQTAAIRRGTRHRNKRLALIQTLFVDVEDVPVVAPGLQPADDSGGEAVFGAGWIKNVGTFLAVQNAYGRDVDIKSLTAASAACLSGRSAASSLTGRWRNSSTLVSGPSVMSILPRPSVPRHSWPAQISSEPGFHRLANLHTVEVMAEY
jgi:hypothetical protein